MDVRPAASETPPPAVAAAPPSPTEALRTRLAQLALEQPRGLAQSVRVWLHEPPAATGRSGVHKTAILLTLVGEEAAAAILARLEEDEVEAITAEIARTKIVDPDEHADVLHEFDELVQNARGLERAGAGLARRLLSRVHPLEDVERLMKQIDPEAPAAVESEPPTTPRPPLPEALTTASPRLLALLLQDEPDQTAALVLAHLPARRATAVLALLDEDRRVEVARRMAAIEEVRPDVVDRVGAVLENRLWRVGGTPAVPVDGVQVAADALAGLSRAAGQEIIDALADEDPDLSRKLRDRLFTFEMLRSLSDRVVQEVIRVADRGALALSLRGADPDVRDMFLRNMPERSAALLREEMDFCGAPRIADIDQAQRRIVDLVLRLEREGAITLEEDQEEEDLARR